MTDIRARLSVLTECLLAHLGHLKDQSMTRSGRPSAEEQSSTLLYLACHDKGLTSGLVLVLVYFGRIEAVRK